MPELTGIADALLSRPASASANAGVECCRSGSALENAFPWLLLAVYGIAWGGLLLNGEIFWDDWTLVGHSPEEVTAAFADAGSWLAPRLHRLLSGSVLAYRVATFLCYLLTGYMFYRVLLQMEQLPRETAGMIALLAVAMPVNQARIAMINFPYAFCLALFFCAWLCLLRAVREKSQLWRGAAGILFVLAFTTPSLLVFFSLPAAHALWLEVRRGEGGLSLIRRIRSYLIGNLDLFCLPVGCFLLSRTLFAPAPTGLYADYNRVTIAGLGAAVPGSLTAIQTSLVEPLIAAVVGLPGAALVLLVSMALAGAWLRQKAAPAPDCPMRVPLELALLGLLVFTIGVFPYNVVGKLPALPDWQSRHQLLVPFGAALLLTSLVQLLTCRIRPLGAPLVLCLVAIFVCADLRAVNAYYWDGVKQQSVIRNLRETTTVGAHPGRAILFRDEFPEANANRRWYRFYELSGFLREAFHDESRFGVLAQYADQAHDWERYHNVYNIDDYRGGTPAGLVRIMPGVPSSRSLSEALRLTLLKQRAPQAYAQEIANFTRVSFLPADQP